MRLIQPRLCRRGEPIGTSVNTMVQGPEVQRLKTRPQFQAALAGGTVSRTAHFALHRMALTAPAGIAPDTDTAVAKQAPPAQALFGVPDVWLGAMVPKRWARRAVTRNAIKRQIYNVATHFAAALPCAAHVVRLRSGFDRQQFISASSEALKAAVRAELEQLFARAVQPHDARAEPVRP